MAAGAARRYHAGEPQEAHTMPPSTGTTPHLLLVEDDPISREFLHAALTALPATVDCAGSAAEARALPARFDLWLIDANLPDGNGAGLLQHLRVASPGTPALAHTADPSPALHEALRGAGFACVVVKPVGTALLQQVVRETLGHAARTADAVPRAATGTLPDWDEQAALQALAGHREHALQLRQLFLAELPAVRAACICAFEAGDDAALRQSLHRLRASCGFVGAANLADVVARWSDTPACPRLRDAFTAAADALQR